MLFSLTKHFIIDRLFSVTENRKKKRKTGLKIRIALQNFKRFNDNKSNFCTSIYMIFYADEKKNVEKKRRRREKKSYNRKTGWAHLPLSITCITGSSAYLPSEQKELSNKCCFVCARFSLFFIFLLLFIDSIKR